jgi:hypothetical protein
LDPGFILEDSDAPGCRKITTLGAWDFSSIVFLSVPDYRDDPDDDGYDADAYKDLFFIITDVADEARKEITEEIAAEYEETGPDDRIRDIEEN